MRNLEHLGDGVYVGHDMFQLWLRANNHDFDKPMLEGGVALEPPVLQALIDYARRHGYLKEEAA